MRRGEKKRKENSGLNGGGQPAYFKVCMLLHRTRARQTLAHSAPRCEQLTSVLTHPVPATQNATLFPRYNGDGAGLHAQYLAPKRPSLPYKVGHWRGVELRLAPSNPTWAPGQTRR